MSLFKPHDCDIQLLKVTSAFCEGLNKAGTEKPYCSTQDRTFDTWHDEEFALQSLINQVTAASGKWGECGKILQPPKLPLWHTSWTGFTNWHSFSHKSWEWQNLRGLWLVVHSKPLVLDVADSVGKKKKKKWARMEQKLGEGMKKGGGVTAAWWKHFIVRC